MPYVSLNDLIANCPNELEAGSMIIFDGCNRVLTTMPQGVSCEDLQDCLSCEWLLDLISFSGGLLVDPQACRVRIDLDYINANIIASFDCNTMELTVGTTTLDLSCIAGLFTFAFSDGVNVDRITNGETIMVQGLHGLQAIVGANLIQIDLPSGATAGQVLTWNALSSVAYWANPIDICCDQIQACMNPIIQSLQHQISIIAQQLCPCGGGEGAYNLVVRSLYNVDATPGDECVLFPLSTLVRSQVMNLNFQCVDQLGQPMCSSCFYASYDSVADDGVVDVNLCLNLERSGCSGDNPYLLSLCGSTVDLTCLAQAPLTTVWGLDDAGDPYTINTVNMNFGDCFVLSDSAVPGGVRIDFNTDTFTRGGCDDGSEQYALSLCGKTLDLSCLVNIIPVRQTAFVMMNGNDTTATIERFDKPFRTIQAAINASAGAGYNMNVIVYSGDYAEIVSLRNNVDVYFHKGTSVKRIQTYSDDVISKVTGHVNILPVWDQELGFGTAIYIGTVRCEVEVDADKIHVLGNGEQFYLIGNRGMSSKLRTRVGSIECHPSISGVITLLYCREEFASIDAVTGVFNSVPSKIRFYTCVNRGEIYRHHSSVIQRTSVNIQAYENEVNSQANVYVQDVFIKGRWYGNNMENGWFTSDGNSKVNVNNLIMDLYPKASTGSKSIVFMTHDVDSTINFYGMNQVRCNDSRDNCTRSSIGNKINVYGRLLSDKDINHTEYNTFNGVKTYERELKRDVPPYMPYADVYDNA